MGGVLGVVCTVAGGVFCCFVGVVVEARVAAVFCWSFELIIIGLSILLILVSV